MFNPTEFSSFQWLFVPLVIFGRYVVFAAIAYFIFYVWKRRDWLYLKIQQRFPTPMDYQREIGYSALTSLIFGVVVWLCLGTPFHIYTRFYSNIDQYGLGWLLLSIPLTVLVHDTYFYWIHRLMHQPDLYRRMHLTHHRSVNPSPGWKRKKPRLSRRRPRRPRHWRSCRLNFKPLPSRPIPEMTSGRAFPVKESESFWGNSKNPSGETTVFSGSTDHERFVVSAGPGS